MRYGYLIISLVVITLLAGCASLSDSIEKRVAVSEECRETLAAPPQSLIPHTNIASVSIGYVGHCDVTHDEKFLAMCSLTQIRTKYGIAPALDPVSISPYFKESARKIDALTRRLPKPQSPRSDLEKATVSFYDAVDDANNAMIHPDRQTIWANVGKLKKALHELNTKLVDSKLPSNVQVASMEAGKALDDLTNSLVSVIGGETMKVDLDAFDLAVSDLRSAMIRLAANMRTLDSKYQIFLQNIKEADFAKRTSAMQEANASVASLKPAVESVRHAHEATRQAARSLSANLSQQASIELAAWDSNLRMQLAQLEQLLSGDFTLVFNAGVRDEVLTHVARRSLELLHGALKPADAVISRLDDKAYGAVSVGYLAFGPNLQDAVDNAFKKVCKVYDDRRRRATTASSAMSTKIFLGELKRAACDNLTQGTQFSMLSELVDTMLISQTDCPPGDDKESASVLSHGSLAVPDSVNFAAPSNMAGLLLPLSKARFIQQNAADAGAASPSPLPVSDITPLSVYATNQWMARQQLLTQKITAALTAPRSDGSSKPSPFQDIETVDEGLVKQIADAATAKAIDDAVRLNPSMLDRSPVGIEPQIRNNINVVTAAVAVSQASAVLKLNLSVSNVNTFSPTNSNTIAPVISVAMPGGPVNLGSACTSIDFESIGVSCFDHGGNVVLTFASQHFRSDSCMPDDLAPALTAVGNMLKGYRARSGTGYQAAVDGYASLPAAKLARCPNKSAEQVRTCSYVNALRQTVPIIGCEGKQSNRNVVLSARRAQIAATSLESAADGAIVIEGLRALGTEAAVKREAGAPASIDQTVVIRLTPGVKQ